MHMYESKLYGVVRLQVSCLWQVSWFMTPVSEGECGRQFTFVEQTVDNYRSLTQMMELA